MVLNIPIKLYYNADGTMYLNGSLNRVPYVMKLSNLTYKVVLVAPIDISTYSVQAFFQKADNTTTTGYAMAHVGTEQVDSETWQVFEMTIAGDVLSISAYGLQNKLGIGFYLTDGNLTPQTFNTEPFWIKCTYAITGNQGEIDETPLEQLQRTLDLALSTKANVDEVVYRIVNLTDYNTQLASESNYGYVYITSSDIEDNENEIDLPKGTILVKNSNGTFTEIGYSKEIVDILLRNIESQITLGYSEVI